MRFQIYLATDYSQCAPCPEDTFNDLTGQVYCRPCGSSSYAPVGSALCSCIGDYRSFQPSYGACVCQSGYVYYDETDTQKEEGNSPENCQQVVDRRCSTSETRMAADRSCVTPGSVDCSLECAFSGSGSLDVSLGRCAFGCFVFVVVVVRRSKIMLILANISRVPPFSPELIALYNYLH